MITFHEIINYEVVGGTLRVLLKRAIGAKKFAIRINYTSELKLITAKNESSIKALAPDLELENIQLKTTIIPNLS